MTAGLEGAAVIHQPISTKMAVAKIIISIVMTLRAARVRLCRGGSYRAEVPVTKSNLHITAALSILHLRVLGNAVRKQHPSTMLVAVTAFILIGTIWIAVVK